MANPYATLANFRAHWGAQKAAALVAGSAVTKDAVIQDALDAAATQLEGSASEGGYVVPIVAATLIADPVRAAQLAALLRLKVVIMSTVLYLQATDGTAKVKEARASCERWLMKLEAGQGLGVSPPAQAADTFGLISMPGASDRLTPKYIAGGRRVNL